MTIQITIHEGRHFQLDIIQHGKDGFQYAIFTEGTESFFSPLHDTQAEALDAGMQRISQHIVTEL